MSPPPTSPQEVLVVVPSRRNSQYEPVYRCSRCRQVGHQRRHCPHTEQTAERYRLEYQAVVREQRRVEAMERAERVAEGHEHALRVEFERGFMRGQSWRREIFGGEGPSRLASAVQEIVFENAEKIPDGIYKQLMDALMIRD